MNFFKIKDPIQQVGPNKFVIGDNPLQPQLTLDGDQVHVPTTLTISGLDFLEYFTGNPSLVNLINNSFTDLRYNLKEAFELDENGDLVPTNSLHISDQMWSLVNENDLELKSNHWRFNQGSESFTYEISF